MITPKSSISREARALLSSGAAIGEEQAALQTGDTFAVMTLFVFLMFEVLQGPLRYYLSSIGGVVLAYAPKGLMVLALVALVVRILWKLRLEKTVLSTAAAFGFFLLVGIYYTHRISQPLMGFFALMPLLFGVVAEPAFSRYGERILPYAIALWLCVAIGVGYNYFHTMPWTGFSYQLGDAEVEASRDWTYFGVERIAGFARASFEAAMQLLVLGLVCTVLLRNRVLAFFVWVATGILIAATTTKTTLGLYFFLTVLMPLLVPRAAPGVLKRTIGRVVPVVLALVGVALPVSTQFSKIGSSFANQDSGTLLVSFGIRLAQMWPDTFTMIFKNGSVLLGRGLGGIGSAQKIFEPDFYSPADNVYLYLYATFGLLAVAIIWTFTRALSRLKFAGSQMATLFWFLGISILMEGWTVSCVEGGTTAVAAGLVAAFSIRLTKGGCPRRKTIASARLAESVQCP